jgi:hypothetical protein
MGFSPSLKKIRANRANWEAKILLSPTRSTDIERKGGFGIARDRGVLGSLDLLSGDG